MKLVNCYIFAVTIRRWPCARTNQYLFPTSEEEDGESNGESDEESEGNENDISRHAEWIGVVERDKEEAFSAGGYSGSIEYALDKQTIIPLGVHTASHIRPRHIIDPLVISA